MPHALASTVGAQTPLIWMNSSFFSRSHTPVVFLHRLLQISISSHTATPISKKLQAKKAGQDFILHPRFRIVQQAKTRLGKKKGLVKKEHLENEKLLYTYFKTLFRKVCMNSAFGKDILKNT